MIIKRIKTICLTTCCAAIAFTTWAAQADEPLKQKNEVTQSDAKETRPNIIVLLCDDLGYGDLECYGHPHIKTPNLNALAEGGIKLSSCYSAAPVCSPSRVGLLTGRSPNRAGVYDWIPPSNGKAKTDARDQVHMRREETTIPQLLKRSGYLTCMSGKWHCNSQFNSPAQPQPSDHGFDHWFGTQNNAGPSHKNPVNYVRNGKAVGPLKGFSCQLAVDEATSWIEKINKRSDSDAQAPFFAYIAFHEPHEPIASPQELVDKYRSVARTEKEAEYFANVENVDLAVGKLVKRLKELGKYENTLIVFTSDNGPETLNRYKNASRSYGRPTPLRGMKLWTTEAGFRVAGILHWPKVIKPNQTSDVPFSSLDLLPTFAELSAQPDEKYSPETSLSSDRIFDGISMVPFINGKIVERKKPLVWAYYNAINERRVAMRHGKWKVLARLSGGIKKITNLHDGNFAEVKKAELTDFQIFDVSNDFDESEDLFSSQNDQSQKLKKLITEQYRELVSSTHVWQRTTGDSESK